MRKAKKIGLVAMDVKMPRELALIPHFAQHGQISALFLGNFFESFSSTK